MTLWLAGKEDTPKPLEEWLVTEYAKQHPGKTLKVSHIDWGELMPRLNTSLQSKDTPDVVEVGNTQSPTFTSVGAFTDLTDKARRARRQHRSQGLRRGRHVRRQGLGRPLLLGLALHLLQQEGVRGCRHLRAEQPRRLPEGGHAAQDRQDARASGCRVRTGATASAGSSPTVVTSPSRTATSGSASCRLPRLRLV